jgi:O-antigen/teichoic acid export membrane protein
MKDLKEKTIRGGLARLTAQGANFALRTISLMVLARLLDPKDFGLVGMVTAFTGVLSLFRDFGLSSAAIQRATVTEEQVSTLFWINILVGALLGVLGIGIAPAIASFYHEPRLIAVTVVLAVGFLFNAAGVQHGALLQRQMRFTALAIINTVALTVGTAVAIGGALGGYGYWSLVAMTVTLPLITTIGNWVTSGWVPGRPRGQSGIRSMLRFGGGITLYGLIGYVATNFEKILLGRFWGVDALGIYGRAYQLINIPTDNLNFAAGEVAFSALSRVQNEPARLKNYFLKGYSFVVAMTLPLTIACALFADDMILVLLGPKWNATAPIFRFLAPTILVFAIANPLSWLLCSIGRVGRLLKMSLVVTPLMIAGYFVGLPYGPKGVAFAYSSLMLLWILPAIAWAVHGTGIFFRDVLLTVAWPLASGAVAAMFALGTRSLYGHFLPPLPRLMLEGVVMLAVYLGMLFFATGQKSFYLDLLRSLRRSSSVEEVKEKDLVSV